MDKLAAIFLCVLVGISAGVIGYAAGVTSIPQPTELEQVLRSMPGGYEVVLENETGAVEDVYSYSGEQYEVKDHGVFLRICSWFGMSANEAAVNRKGIALDAHKGTIGGGAGDYSWLDRTWYGLRSAFWTIIFVAIVLVILPFVPYVGPVVREIYRFIAGLLPTSGWWERLLGKQEVQKEQAVTEDIVKSVEAGKDALSPDARKAFGEAVKGEQDKPTEARVKAIKEP